MTSPLNGIRVLDLTNVLAGPFCCHQLAHLGAEVIKVEAPGRGDLARQLGADPDLNAANMGISFLAQNAGKSSVTINLKHDDGKALFLRLLETADVLVENFRPGVMDRLGLGYSDLKPNHPNLIYCAISGFGQDGDWVDRPAYDQIIQGVSGVMSVTGDEKTGPTRVGYPIADTVGGLTAAMAVSAALNQSPRGTFIDVSMLESVLATMGWVVSNHLNTGVAPKPNGNENPTSAPSGTFQTATGPMNIAANKDAQWVLLTDHLGLAALRSHPDYATREERKTNRIALRVALEVVLMTRPAADWADELNAIGVPAGVILSVPEILQSPQISTREFLSEFNDVPGVNRPVTVGRTGLKMDAVSPKVETPPPTLGQHGDAIWGSLGLSREDVEALRDAGAI